VDVYAGRLLGVRSHCRRHFSTAQSGEGRYTQQHEHGREGEVEGEVDREGEVLTKEREKERGGERERVIRRTRG
jgi:hypothetical protein